MDAPEPDSWTQFRNRFILFTGKGGVGTPTPVPGIQRLDAMDIDPHAAADSYRARVIDPLMRETR
jgi:anion-transporting  ArsA/GET3 family ATPase